MMPQKRKIWGRMKKISMWRNEAEFMADKGHSLFYGTSQGEKLGQWNASFLPSQVCACVAHPESLTCLRILAVFCFPKDQFFCSACILHYICQESQMWVMMARKPPTCWSPKHILQNQTFHLPSTVSWPHGLSSPWELEYLCSALFSPDHHFFQKKPRAAVFEMRVKGSVLFGELWGFLKFPGISCRWLWNYNNRRSKLASHLTVVILSPWV